MYGTIFKGRYPVSIKSASVNCGPVMYCVAGKRGVLGFSSSTRIGCGKRSKYKNFFSNSSKNVFFQLPLCGVREISRVKICSILRSRYMICGNKNIFLNFNYGSHVIYVRNCRNIIGFDFDINSSK